VGAVALGEIDEVTKRLHARIDERRPGTKRDGPAEKIEKGGDRAAAEGKQATAGNYYLRAGNYFYTGERMVPRESRSWPSTGEA